MSDPERIRGPEVAVPSDRYRLGEQLEAASKRMSGITRESFIDQRSLCTSCQHATIIRRASQNARTVTCSMFSRLVPEDISECTAYFKFGELSLSQMASIAHLINDRAENQSGYL